jgi:colanic acid biosynthesis glycosyl transferase WcaI
MDSNFSRARRIVFLNRYFYPDHSATSQMLSDLAFELAQHGDSVSVITSRQLYDAPDARLPARETYRGVSIRRVATSRFGRKSSPGRAIDYLTFYVSSAWALWKIAREGDLVVAKTDPPLLGVVVGPIARLRRAMLVNWLQDIFPEVAEATGFARHRLARFAFRLLAALRNRSLRMAAANVVIGERMAARLEALAVSPSRIHFIPNWTDGSSIRPVDHAGNSLRAAWDLSGKFVVGYSGNLGRAHDYSTFLDAIELVEAQNTSKQLTNDNATAGAVPAYGESCPGIIWLFIGGGASFRALQVEVCRRGLTSVQFRDYQPRERLAESLSTADVHLISLSPGLEGLIVPSKYYGIAAAGRPAIFVGDENGEIAQILRNTGSGYSVRPGQGIALAELVAQLAENPARVREMGRNARTAFDQRYDQRWAMASWAALLDKISGEEATRRDFGLSRSQSALLIAQKAGQNKRRELTR